MQCKDFFSIYQYCMLTKQVFNPPIVSKCSYGLLNIIIEFFYFDILMKKQSNYKIIKKKLNELINLYFVAFIYLLERYLLSKNKVSMKPTIFTFMMGSIQNKCGY